ncbi:MAG: alanine racemase [Candidatus Kapaibacterium sp.]
MAHINTIDTPALIIERSVLENNLLKMQHTAEMNVINLRPHIKTHKMPRLAAMQIDHGAIGIACAKLGEAEIIAAAGIDNIQIANIITGQQKIERLIRLNERISRLSVCVDSPESASELSKAFAELKPIRVLIEVDSGFHRAGIESFDKIAELARDIISMPGIEFEGIMTHAGHAYAAPNPREVRRVGLQEGKLMSDLKIFLEVRRIPCRVVSVGSTPTARWCSRGREVTELRAGNYIFHDMIQVMLGSCKIEDCALNVLSTVISVPTEDRAVIDAGSKALGLDLGGHGNTSLSGHGYIYNKDAEIVRLSEEHGVLRTGEDNFKYGERIRIIPNHACAVVNLYDRAYLVDKEEIIEEIEIAARGRMQ